MLPAPKFTRAAAASLAALALTLGAATTALAQKFPTDFQANSYVSGPRPDTTTYNGATNYVLRCAGCHNAHGTGAPHAGIPTFVDSIGAIVAEDLGRTYALQVPGVTSSGLTDSQMADVMNYVVAKWSDEPFDPFTPEEVAARRVNAPPDVVVARRELVRYLDSKGITIAAYPWP